MRRLRILGVVALALAAPFVFPRTARAQTDEAVEKAKEHFERGYDFFAQKRYQDAAAEFRTAYTFKPFAEFLFNEAVAYERMGRKPDAISRYEQYIKQATNPKDKQKAQDRIDGLRGAGTTPSEKPPAPETGILIIDSVPSGANVYIDDKKETVGTTPWNGSFVGQHKLIVEAKGYKTYADAATVRAGSLNTLKVVLTPEPNLAWVEIRANVAGASVFIDDRASGEVGRTPYLGNLIKGKHKIWVSKDGYVEQYREVDLEGGKAYPMNDFVLAKGTIGFFYMTGRNVENAKVTVDGKMVCEKAPCRFQAPQGKRTIEVTKDGYKPYHREQDVMAATETTLNVSLVEKPSRLDVLWNFGFAAVFLTGGIVLGLQSNSTYNGIKDDIAAGKPPVFPDDSRYTKGKIFAIASDACFAIGIVTAATGVVSLLLDKGPDSTGLGETKELGGITPVVGPGFAGVSAGVRW
ncbi:MAG TPA: PEGA domain-containing protein [Haliangiales bacterium]|nr:PEGA domain-containing protein [Haliangiales bacterium]